MHVASKIPALPINIHNESETLLCSATEPVLESRSGLLVRLSSLRLFWGECHDFRI